MQRVTMEDVAREAGVSRALVSIAYRGVEGVSEKTREKIFEIGEKLGYIPNSIASRLAGKSLNTIGVYIQDLHNDVFADVYDGIRSVTEPHDIHLVLAVGGSDNASELHALSTLISSRVDVIIAAGLTITDAELHDLSRKVRLVTVARRAEGIDAAYSDNYEGAKLATQHLLAGGHTRVAFLSNPQTDGYLDRQQGYQDTMTSAGLLPHVIPTTYSRATASRDAESALNETEPPTAFFAHNDQAALGVLDLLATSGLKPGKDIAVVGYDNSTISQMPISALSTVNLDGEELGRQAGLIAISRLSGDNKPAQHVTLQPTLVARASSTR